MTARPWIAACAAVCGLVLLALPVMAGQVTERQKQNCRTDYKRFCSEYGLGTEGLRACMSRSFKKLTNACVSALVADGEVSKKQADSIRGKKSSSAKKTTHKSSSSKKRH